MITTDLLNAYSPPLSESHPSRCRIVVVSSALELPYYYTLVAWCCFSDPWLDVILGDGALSTAYLIPVSSRPSTSHSHPSVPPNGGWPSWVDGLHVVSLNWYSLNSCSPRDCRTKSKVLEMPQQDIIGTHSKPLLRKPAAALMWQTSWFATTLWKLLTKYFISLDLFFFSRCKGEG